MNVYLVALCGRDMCHHYGVYRTYESACKRWDMERLDELHKYLEWQADGTFDWSNEIALYSATTPEEHIQIADDTDSSMDVIKILVYELQE